MVAETPLAVSQIGPENRLDINGWTHCFELPASRFYDRGGLFKLRESKFGFKQFLKVLNYHNLYRHLFSVPGSQPSDGLDHIRCSTGIGQPYEVMTS